MVLNAESGMQTIGFYEVRCGQCPDCGTTFDDSVKRDGDKRYCPKCKAFKLGNLKQAGVLKKEGE
jgi:predicted Zn-ribbon and HTH transcriptional regulator